MKKTAFLFFIAFTSLFVKKSQAQTNYAGLSLHYAVPMDNHAKSLFDFGIGPKGSYLFGNKEENFLVGGSAEILNFINLNSGDYNDSSLERFMSYSVSGKAVYYPFKETFLMMAEGGHSFGKVTKYPFIKPSIGYQSNSGWLFETGYQVNFDKQNQFSFLTFGGTHYWNMN